MKSLISLDDFTEMDLRVGQVIKAEEKEDSEKLLRLTVDFGEEGTRNILTGIKQWYHPKDLKGKQFIFIFNLKPRTMMEEVSEGMILAAEGEDKPILLKPSEETKPGATIR